MHLTLVLVCLNFHLIDPKCGLAGQPKIYFSLTEHLDAKLFGSNVSSVNVCTFSLLVKC